MAHNEATKAVFKLGVGPIVALLDRHKDDAEACAEVCNALSCLADGPCGVRSKAIVAMGAVLLLAAVFRTHNGNTKDKAHDALIVLGYTANGDRK